MLTNAEIKEIVAGLKTRQAKRFEKHVDEALDFFRLPEEQMVAMEIEIYEAIVEAGEKNSPE